MTLSAIIEDGYTRHSRLKGKERMYPSVSFKWRPTGIVQRATFSAALNQMGLSAEKRETIGAEILAKQIVEWDVANSSGNVLPITPQNCLKLHPELFNRLYAVIVTMSQAPDEDLDDNDLTPAYAAAGMEGLGLDEYLEKNS